MFFQTTFSIALSKEWVEHFLIVVLSGCFFTVLSIYKIYPCEVFSSNTILQEGYSYAYLCKGFDFVDS